MINYWQHIRREVTSLEDFWDTAEEVINIINKRKQEQRAMSIRIMHRNIMLARVIARKEARHYDSCKEEGD